MNGTAIIQQAAGIAILGVEALYLWYRYDRRYNNHQPQSGNGIPMSIQRQQQRDSSGGSSGGESLGANALECGEDSHLENIKEVFDDEGC